MIVDDRNKWQKTGNKPIKRKIIDIIKWRNHAGNKDI